MELMIRVAAAAVTAAVLSAVLRKDTPEFSLLLVLAAGLGIMALCAGALGTAWEVLRELIRLTGLEDELFAPVIKAVIVSMITRMTVEVCRGTGEKGIAAVVETAGAVCILGVSLPLIRAVVVMMGELVG